MRKFMGALALVFIVLTVSCSDKDPLPYFGKETPTSETAKTIKPFEFVNHRGETINETTVEGKIYVADFFFTSCPGICPVMKRHLTIVQEKYIDNEQVVLLSHTIDPKRDSIERLYEFTAKLGIAEEENWHFLTGEKTDLYDMAGEYMISAYADEQAPGGFEHSGKFILVDHNRHIRGYYDGTDEDEVDVLLKDMDKLLKELNTNEK